MDLAYLRAHPEQLPTFLTHQRIRETPVGGGSICTARRLTLEDGASVFAKSFDGTPPGHFFESEAMGLRWLAEAAAVPVPEVIAALPELLVLEWVDPAPPSPAAAERFGRDLAGLHRAGASGFGAPWPGFIGLLPQDNSGGDGIGPGGVDQGGEGGAWPEWFAARRLEPYLRQAADRGALTRADVETVERVLARIDAYGQAGEPPSRLHGDLWYGNLLWTNGGVTLVDPAAHGGHRETDLAQLALFGGAPQLERILAAYDEAWPLPAGWRERMPLHQLHLLLVHAAMFGASYRDSVLAAARGALRAS